MGNCQIDTLYLAYRDYVLPFCDDEAAYIEIYKKITEENNIFLHRSDIIIVQNLDTIHETNFYDFHLEGKIYFVPYAPFSGVYWPYGGFNHQKNLKYKYSTRFEPYNHERGDLYLNRLIEKGVSADECVERYLNEDINKTAKLDRRLEMALAVIKKRDEACGYGVAEFIRDNFQKELLFSSPGHFRRSISLLLINELLGRLDVEPRLIERLNRLYPGNPHGGNDILPIHPQVAEHFKLGFIAENQRYRYWFEGRFTFAEYCARYARFEFNEPLVEAILHAVDGKHEKAVPCFEQALKISPLSGYGQRSFSHSLAAVGRHDEALAMAREAAAILYDDPEELPDTLEHLSHLLTQSGAASDAEAVARRAIALAPNRPPLYRLLASALERQGRRDDAARVIGDLAILDPLDHEAPAHLGHMLAARGDLEGAAEAFRCSLAIVPRQAGTLGALSHTLGGLGQREEAIAAARCSLALNPDDSGTLAHLGNLLRQSGENGQALVAYRQALALTTNNPGARPSREEIEHWLAETLARQEQHQGATSTEGETPRREGQTLFHAGDFAEAEQAFRAALARDESDPDRHWWLSNALDRQGRKAEAAAAAEEATKRAPDKAWYWEHLGHMRASTGEIEAAERAFRQACAIEPDRAGALGALSHVLGALGRRQEAIGAARAAIALRPDDADLQFHRGNLLMQAGAPGEAADAYRQAITLGRAGEDIEHRLAEALRLLEDVAESSQAIELEPNMADKDPAAMEKIAPQTPPSPTIQAPETPRHGLWRRIFGPRQVFGR